MTHQTPGDSPTTPEGADRSSTTPADGSDTGPQHAVTRVLDSLSPQSQLTMLILGLARGGIGGPMDRALAEAGEHDRVDQLFNYAGVNVSIGPGLGVAIGREQFVEAAEGEHERTGQILDDAGLEVRLTDGDVAFVDADPESENPVEGE